MMVNHFVSETCKSPKTATAMAIGLHVTRR